MPANEMQPHELMQRAVEILERFQVPYRIVGSMASMAYGEARFTNDINILVDMNIEVLKQLALDFPEPDYYLSIPAAEAAIRDRRQFNIIHAPSGLKLDIIQRKDTEFGTLDITAGQRLKSDGFYDAWFASPENIVLMKLRCYRDGGSDKHLRDIASILLIQNERIDRDYLADWSTKLGIRSEWQLILQRLSHPDESSEH